MFQTVINDTDDNDNRDEDDGGIEEADEKTNKREQTSHIEKCTTTDSHHVYDYHEDS